MDCQNVTSFQPSTPVKQKRRSPSAIKKKKRLKNEKRQRIKKEQIGFLDIFLSKIKKKQINSIINETHKTIGLKGGLIISKANNREEKRREEKRKPIVSQIQKRCITFFSI